MEVMVAFVDGDPDRPLVTGVVNNPANSVPYDCPPTKRAWCCAPTRTRARASTKSPSRGHKPGYEFWKHQESAQGRGISREQFINEYSNAAHYRPELPSSNQSHRLEAPDDLYYGD